MPSQVRSAVLSRLLLDSRDWHPRELARELGLSNSAVALELAQLRLHGVASVRRVGNQSRYRANQDCPVYGELRGLMLKTAGLADVIRAALEPLQASIALAYIFGSFADGTQRSGSDVDLMVVGQLEPEQVFAALSTAEHTLSREVNAAVYGQAQYRRELALGRGFIHQIHTAPTILLSGNMDEFG